MDSFKIILTREQNKTFYSAIPHNWENNSFVYWPTKLPHNKRESLRSNANSKPGNDWTKLKCTVKCSNIPTFKEALHIEKQFCDCSDTESEQTIFSENKNKTLHYAINRNNMFEASINEENVKTDSLVPLVDGANLEIDENSAPLLVKNHGENGELLLITSNEMKEMQTDILEMKAEMAILNEDIKQIKQQYVKININLEKILGILIKKQHEDVATTVNENTEMSSTFKFPLELVDEVNRLDQELRNNEQFKLFMIRTLSKIGGTQGTDDGFKIGYKITDHIFHPKILMDYTWTGVSRRGSQSKKPFNALHGICDLYYNTILLADNRHTLQKNEDIFKKGILKHAKKRTLRKRLKLNQTVNDANVEPDDLNNLNSEDDDVADTAFEPEPYELTIRTTTAIE